MNVQELTRQLTKPTETRIVLLVADGLGGLPQASAGGRTELESADTPHLDELAARGVTGLIDPVLPGITCGSGPGHLALFGYDPLRYAVGRGVLSALGVEFQLQSNDVAARGNFCTVDDQGRVTDRRAGRIPDEDGRRLVERLRGIRLEGAEVCAASVTVVVVLLLCGFSLPLALLLAALAPASAPAATLDVVREAKAKGPVTDTVLGVVAIDDAYAGVKFSSPRSCSRRPARRSAAWSRSWSDTISTALCM